MLLSFSRGMTQPEAFSLLCLLWSGAIVSPFQAALASGILPEWGVAGPIYLCSFFPASCSTSATLVQVSPVLLPAALSEIQPKTHMGHLPTHNSALPWVKLFILPFLTCFSGSSYPLNTDIFQTVIQTVHQVSAPASELNKFMCLIFFGLE